MINIVADLHMHTNASTHAFNTITEMIKKAKEIGLFAIAITNHAPLMPDGVHFWHFLNLVRLDSKLDDMWVLKGVELNVVDESGKLDFSSDTLKELSFDWVVASIHRDVVNKPFTFELATQLWLNVVNNPHVDMLGHSEMEAYKYDYDLVAKECTKVNKIIELNAGSSIVRPGNEKNLIELAKACMKNETKIAVNTDAHSIYALGKYSNIPEMLAELNFPKELIVNASVNSFVSELSLHNKKIAVEMQKEITLQ